MFRVTLCTSRSSRQIGEEVRGICMEALICSVLMAIDETLAHLEVGSSFRRPDHHFLQNCT